MCQPQQQESLILCHKCDLLVALPVLGELEKACCPRCHATLTVRWNDPSHRLNTYSVAALFMLLVTNLFPLISMNVADIHSNVTLPQIPQVMLSENHVALGVFFLLFVLLVPAFCLISVLLLINPLPLPLGVKIALARILFWLKTWGMSEIFLAAVLVSVVKLVTYGEIAMGWSFLPLCLFCLLQVRVFQCLDRYWLWQRIAPSPPLQRPLQPGVCGIKQGVRLCGCCHAILPQDQMRCSRCHCKGYVRCKHSLQWTLALLLTAMMLYLPANILPMMYTELLGNQTSSTILAGIILLWGEGAYPVALVIFIASILVPGLKMAALGWLCWYANGHGGQHSSVMYRIYEVVEFVGRWSMIDVFVIAVLSALVRIGGLMNVYPANGALLFAFVVILTMFSALAFDPRLCWDRVSSRHNEES